MTELKIDLDVWEASVMVPLAEEWPSLLMAYDEEHNVHILVLQDWGKESHVWAYRYMR